MNIKAILSRILGLVAVLSLFCFSSCNKNEWETKGFTLYYMSMTDIGPSMAGVIASPTYIGGTPESFRIVSVKLDEQKFEAEELFTINESTGEVLISSSRETKVGIYKISVACTVDGSEKVFADVIEVNFLKPVPESIVVEPNYLEAEYTEVSGQTYEKELPTAQIKTEEGHISIIAYNISSVLKDGKILTDGKKLFSVSNEGKISINRSRSFLPGVYQLSFKLNTAVSDSQAEDGIFENAYTLKVTSAPVSLTYSPNPARMEEQTGTNMTSFSGLAPELIGSTDELSYSIETIIPTSNKFSINASTGAISVAQGHGFQSGESYSIDVRVKNAYCKEGKLFKAAFTLNVIEFINPIANFSYSPESSYIQATSFSIEPNASMTGDDVIFEFVEISEEDQNYINLNKNTGVISAAKGNKLSIGTHTVKVRAKNDKNEQTAQVNIVISKNPNLFSFFKYGNNLSLTEEQSQGVSQFYAANATELQAMRLTVKSSDIPEGAVVKWTVDIKAQMAGTTINASTGEITPAGYKAHQTGVIFVTATIGEGDAAVSVTEPVFFSFATAITPSGASTASTIRYKPFVLRVNPQKGGKLVGPEINPSQESLFMDYRRTFQWINLDGKTSDGTPHISGRVDQVDGFLRHIVVKYFEAVGKTPNYSSKDPFSYFSNSTALTNALIYVDNSNSKSHLSIVVNPGKWYDDGWADGVFHGQITCATSQSAINSGTQIFPVAIWFDKDYEN